MANEGGADCSCAPGSTKVCYSGPPSTVGVGLCHGGMQSCLPSGSGYDACAGEVTPVPETCMTPGDDDCDGLTNEEGLGCVCPPDSMIACYTGPAGTAGMGICKAGTATCNAQGTAYEPCEGEVLPQIENCNTPDDENCDGSPGPCAADPAWGKGFPAPGGMNVRMVAVDAQGNVIIGGQFHGTVDFGGGPLVSVGNPGFNIYVAKFDGLGNHLWSKRFGDGVGSTGQSVQGLAFDATGNILMTGAFSGTINFGGGVFSGPGANSTDIYVTKLDPNGGHIWSHQYGNANQSHYEFGTGITADPAGNVLVTGNFYSSIDFGGGLLSLQNNNSLFILKLDAAGNHLWSKGSGAASSVSTIAADGVGNVLVTGDFAGTMNLGGAPLQSQGQDLFVAKLSSTGAHLWSKRFGDVSGEMGRSITADGDGNVVITGNFDKTLNFGAGNLGGGAPSGTHKGFVAKFDPNGGHIWSRGFGDVYADSMSVAVDAGKNVLIAGEVRGNVDFGGGAIPGGDQFPDIYVTKFDPAGNLSWAIRTGDLDPQSAFGIATNAAGDPFVTGTYTGTIQLGGAPLSSMVLSVFLSRLVP
ncbi:MAG: SBBP repeat-containing protein [Byssovorax sp.]